MKTSLTFSLLLLCFYGFSQKAEYGNLTKKSSYEEYLTKSGDIIKIGDTLTLGIPTSDLGFTYISQGGQRVSNTLSNKTVIIDQLKTYGTKSQGFKLYVHFKGYGLVPVLIDYETALETGEIINENAKMTKEEAIKKLKGAKDLLDLEIINQSKYDSLKNALTPFILN